MNNSTGCRCISNEEVHKIFEEMEYEAKIRELEQKLKDMTANRDWWRDQCKEFYDTDKLSNLWISVKDKLPPVHFNVLVYCGDDEYHIARIDKYLRWYVGDGSYWLEDEPERWMPLPKTQLCKCDRCGLLVDKDNIYSLSVYPADDVPFMVCEDCCSGFYRWFNEG